MPPNNEITSEKKLCGHILFPKKTYCDELYLHNLNSEQMPQPVSKQTKINSDLRNGIFFFRFGKAISITLHLIHAISQEIANRYCYISQ
jgi:hypothetical protein